MEGQNPDATTAAEEAALEAATHAEAIRDQIEIHLHELAEYTEDPWDVWRFVWALADRMERELLDGLDGSE